jgi:hypothetical protein
LTLIVKSCTIFQGSVVVTDNDNAAHLLVYHTNIKSMSGNPSEEQLSRAGNEPAYVTLQDVAALAGVSIKLEKHSRGGWFSPIAFAHC